MSLGDEPATSWRDSLNIPKGLDDGPLWEEVWRLEANRFLERVERYKHEQFGNTKVPPTFSASPNE